MHITAVMMVGGAVTLDIAPQLNATHGKQQTALVPRCRGLQDDLKTKKVCVLHSRQYHGLGSSTLGTVTLQEGIADNRFPRFALPAACRIARCMRAIKWCTVFICRVICFKADFQLLNSAALNQSVSTRPDRQARRDLAIASMCA